MHVKYEAILKWYNKLPEVRTLPLNILGWDTNPKCLRESLPLPLVGPLQAHLAHFSASTGW